MRVAEVSSHAELFAATWTVRGAFRAMSNRVSVTSCVPSRRSRPGQRHAVEDADLLVVELNTGAIRIAQVQAVQHATVRTEVFDLAFVEAKSGCSCPGKSKKPSRLPCPASKKKCVEPA